MLPEGWQERGGEGRAPFSDNAYPPSLAPVEPAVESSAAASTARGSGGTLRELERQLFLDALPETGGNRNQAAKRLGMSRRARYYKLERYGIEPDRSG